MKIIALLLACMLSGLCSSCHLFYTTISPAWEEIELECSSRKRMFDASALALSKAGFPLGTGANPAKSTLRTGWSTSGSPFKGRGYRERAHVTYEQAKKGWFLLRVRVEREINQSFRPLEEQYSKWEASPDSSESARRVIQFASALLRTSRESDEDSVILETRNT